MKILTINYNTSKDFSKTIDSAMKKYSAQSTEITTVNPEEGPELLSSVEAMEAQTNRVIDIIRQKQGEYDVFILAVASDSGLETSRQIARYVLGIGESAIFTACTLAKKFSFLTVNNLPKEWASERLNGLGIDPNRCVSARCVGSGDASIVPNRHEKRDLFYQVGKQCIDEDGANTLVLGCPGTSDLKEYLQDRLMVPVIAGPIAALKIAEQLPTS
jgi:allantoin racemase